MANKNGKLYVSAKDETVRMFKSDFLEFFTHVHPLTPLVLFIPVIAYFYYTAFVTQHMTLSAVGLWTVVGLIVWTFTEYFMHRFVFHFTPIGPISERIIFIFHGVHHDYPQDSKRLVMPPLVSIALSTGFYFLFKELFGAQVIAPLYASFLIGYLAYDMTHYTVHHIQFKSAWFNMVKANHLRHHYRWPERLYGVSSPLWDYILGSMPKATAADQKVVQEVLDKEQLT